MTTNLSAKREKDFDGPYKNGERLRHGRKVAALVHCGAAYCPIFCGMDNARYLERHGTDRPDRVALVDRHDDSGGCGFQAGVAAFPPSSRRASRFVASAPAAVAGNTLRTLCIVAHPPANGVDERIGARVAGAAVWNGFTARSAHEGVDLGNANG